MSHLPFARLFSMPAFEGLRLLRIYVERRPDDPIDMIVAIIQRVEADAHSYDMTTAVALHEIVPRDAPVEGVRFYRACLYAVFLIELPEWAKLTKLGRGRFIKRLKAPELRDVRSLFRQARLMDEPPSLDDIAWWDELQTHVRSRESAEAMKRARAAEQLSLEHEARCLKGQGINQPPVWMAIEDNTVGYDVLSYTRGMYGLINKLIEVKSTIASPLRFIVSRNEWEQALTFGEAFVFHIWNLRATPPRLFEMTVAEVAKHIPQDQRDGEWKTAQIPVGS